MLTFITREQDYALRIVAMLAGLKKDERLSIRKLSGKLLISKNFAARISHKLIQGDILGSKQGKAGGIYLIKDPERLSLYDVLIVIGFRTRINLCLDDSFVCGLNDHCKFHKLFGSMEQDIYKKLKEEKISDFVLDY
ncbi:RrF2 family transcriptional regulator [Bacteroidota bacterium]